MPTEAAINRAFGVLVASGVRTPENWASDDEAGRRAARRATAAAWARMPIDDAQLEAAVDAHLQGDPERSRWWPTPATLRAQAPHREQPRGKEERWDDYDALTEEQQRAVNERVWAMMPDCWGGRSDAALCAAMRVAIREVTTG